MAMIKRLSSGHMVLQALKYPVHAVKCVALLIFLYLVGVRMIDTTRYRTVLECGRCRQRWSIPAAPKYPDGFWRCPAGCNADGLR